MGEASSGNPIASGGSGCGNTRLLLEISVFGTGVHSHISYDQHGHAAGRPVPYLNIICGGNRRWGAGPFPCFGPFQVGQVPGSGA